MSVITKEMTIGEVLQMDRGTARVFMQSGMHCLGCPHSQMESIEEAGMVHGIDVEVLIKQLNEHIAAAADTK